MKTIAIEVELRKRTGKGGARESRREGRIPGVLYGQGKMMLVSVDRHEFVHAMYEAHGENILFDVKVPGEKEPLKSIAREVQHDPVSRAAVHVDFQHIDMNRPIHVKVAVHLTGQPEGAKNFGGILEHQTREVEVLCLPAQVPSHIVVDVSQLLVGQSIHVRDLPAADYQILDDPSRVIAQVAAPTVEKVVTPAEEAAAAAVPAEGEAAEGAKEEAGTAKAGSAKGAAKGDAS
jgi:large subunit ribosomal protein L25